MRNAALLIPSALATLTLLTLAEVAAAAPAPSPLQYGNGCEPPPPPPPPPPPGGGSGPTNPGPSAPSNPAPSGPSTPGPTGPSTPSTPSAGPAYRPTPPVPPPAPGAPPLPKSPSGSSAADLHEWSRWWAYNVDPYLELREHVHSSAALTGSDDFLLGYNSTSTQQSMAPGEAQVSSVAGPALLRVLDGDPSSAVLASTMIALGKLNGSFEPADGRKLADEFVARLDHSNQYVSEAAITALGLLGEPSAAARLCDIASDSEAGRNAVGRESVTTRARTLAALSLGLIGANCDREDVRRFIVSRLASVLDGDAGGSAELGVACVTAIGLSPLSDGRRVADEQELPAAASRQGEVRFLIAVLQDKRGRELVRAHAPKALAALVHGDGDLEKTVVVEALLDELSSRKAKRLVSYGVLEALGELGDADADELDEEIRSALYRAAKDGDSFEKQLALTSLALVTSRPGSGEGEALAAAREAHTYLLDVLARGKTRVRPWAALALGLQGYHTREAGYQISSKTSVALRHGLDEVRSSSEGGAWCVALGLRRDVESVPALLERLAETHDEVVKGQTAIALGLVGDREAVPVLRDLLLESQFRPAILRDVSIALALLDDKAVVLDLMATIRDGRSMAVKSAAVSALAYVGDARVVDPLVALLEDESQLDQTRSFAALALGVVCEQGELPWTARYSNHMNYSAGTETLTGAGTGFLSRR